MSSLATSALHQVGSHVVKNHVVPFINKKIDNYLQDSTVSSSSDAPPAKKRKMDVEMASAQTTAGGSKGGGSGNTNMAPIVSPIPRPMRQNEFVVTLKENFWAYIKAGEVYTDIGYHFPKGLFGNNQINQLFWKFLGAGPYTENPRNPLCNAYELLTEPKFKMSNIIFLTEELDTTSSTIQLTSASQLNYLIAVKIDGGQNDQYFIRNGINPTATHSTLLGLPTEYMQTDFHLTYQPCLYNQTNVQTKYGRTFVPLTVSNTNTFEKTIDNLWLAFRNNDAMGNLATGTNFLDNYMVPISQPHAFPFGYNDTSNSDDKLNEINDITSYSYLPELRNQNNLEFIGHGGSFQDKIRTNLEGKKLAVNTGINFNANSDNNSRYQQNLFNYTENTGSTPAQLTHFPMYPNNRISLYNRDRKDYTQTYEDTFENKKYRHHTYFMLNPIRKSDGNLQKTACQVFIEKEIVLKFYFSADYGLEKDTIANGIDGIDVDANRAHRKNIYYMPHYQQNTQNGAIYGFNI